MRQLLIFLAFIIPIILNAQKFHQQMGFGLGTFARSQHFKASSFNASINYGLNYTNKHFGIGFIYSLDLFPKYNYSDENIKLTFFNIGADFFLLSKENSGFLVGGTIEHPLVINDGFKSNKEKKMQLIPSFNIGILEKKIMLLLSYKHYIYENSYRIASLSLSDARAIETVRISTVRLLLKYRIE